MNRYKLRKYACVQFIPEGWDSVHDVGVCVCEIHLNTKWKGRNIFQFQLQVRSHREKKKADGRDVRSQVMMQSI